MVGINYVPKRWLVVLEATMYTRIYGQQELGKWWCVASREPTNIGKIFVAKLYIRIKYFCTFSVYKNIFTTKKSKLRYSLLVWYIIDTTVLGTRIYLLIDRWLLNTGQVSLYRISITGTRSRGHKKDVAVHNGYNYRQFQKSVRAYYYIQSHHCHLCSVVSHHSGQRSGYTGRCCTRMLQFHKRLQ